MQTNEFEIVCCREVIGHESSDHGRGTPPILFPHNQTAAAKRWLTAIASQPGLTSQDFAVSATTKAAQTNATHKLWLGPHEGSYAGLSTIRARTLVAYGTKDVIVPDANAQILLKRIPHVNALRVSDAGHAFLFQNPSSTARAFTAFLSAGSGTHDSLRLPVALPRSST